MKRRDFIASSATAVGYSMAVSKTARSANDRITVAVVGARDRGRKLLEAFASRPTVDVKYVCDVDQDVLESRTGQVAEQTGRQP